MIRRAAIEILAVFGVVWVLLSLLGWAFGAAW